MGEIITGEIKLSFTPHRVLQLIKKIASLPNILVWTQLVHVCDSCVISVQLISLKGWIVMLI